MYIQWVESCTSRRRRLLYVWDHLGSLFCSRHGNLDVFFWKPGSTQADKLCYSFSLTSPRSFMFWKEGEDHEGFRYLLGFGIEKICAVGEGVRKRIFKSLGLLLFEADTWNLFRLFLKQRRTKTYRGSLRCLEILEQSTCMKREKVGGRWLLYSVIATH